MRRPRLKPDYQDTWHHCYNRLVGTHLDRPLSPADREQFVRLLHRVARLYTVRIVAYQVLSNHFHLLLQAPAELPSPEETARRFEAFHRGRRRLLPGSPACEQWRRRLRDVSWCLRHLQHLYTAWYNRTRPVRRRGPLWAGRFKNTVLESGAAVWACWVYIEDNPRRAGLTADSADYRWGSYGHWRQTGRHPFAEAFRAHLKPHLPEPLATGSDRAVRRALAAELARRAEEDRQAMLADVPLPEVAPAQASNGETVESVPMAETAAQALRRRLRCWVDGVVIGSELFVRETMARVRSPRELARQRLTGLLGAPPLWCWTRLRTAAP